MVSACLMRSPLAEVISHQSLLANDMPSSVVDRLLTRAEAEAHAPAICLIDYKPLRLLVTVFKPTTVHTMASVLKNVHWHGGGVSTAGQLDIYMYIYIADRMQSTCVYIYIIYIYIYICE